MIDATRDRDLHELMEEASHLAPNHRRVLIAHARELGSSEAPAVGTPLRELKPFFGIFDPQSGDEIEAAILEEFGRIDHEGW